MGKRKRSAAREAPEGATSDSDEEASPPTRDERDSSIPDKWAATDRRLVVVLEGAHLETVKVLTSLVY